MMFIKNFQLQSIDLNKLLNQVDFQKDEQQEILKPFNQIKYLKIKHVETFQYKRIKK